MGDPDLRVGDELLMARSTGEAQEFAESVGVPVARIEFQRFGAYSRRGCPGEGATAGRSYSLLGLHAVGHAKMAEQTPVFFSKALESGNDASAGTIPTCRVAAQESTPRSPGDLS